MTAHRGPAGECPVCRPLILAARAAGAEWTTQQVRARRGSAAYRAAHRAAREAGNAVTAAKLEHYGPRVVLS